MFYGGVFTSVPELIEAIDEYIAHHNNNPKPFIWTKSARDIMQKVILANDSLSSKQNATLHWQPVGLRNRRLQIDRSGLFFAVFLPNINIFGCEIDKNYPRWGRFSLSTT